MGERKGKSTLVHREEILELSGVGATLREALVVVFSQVQSAAGGSDDQVLIHVTPEEMEIIDAVEEVHTEKFLGFLFPKKKKRISIKVRLTVKISSISIHEILIRKNEIKKSTIQHLKDMN